MLLFFHITPINTSLQLYSLHKSDYSDHIPWSLHSTWPLDNMRFLQPNTIFKRRPHSLNSYCWVRTLGSFLPTFSNAHNKTTLNHTIIIFSKITDDKQCIWPKHPICHHSRIRGRNTLSMLSRLLRAKITGKNKRPWDIRPKALLMICRN